jgi:hypothetical protein
MNDKKFVFQYGENEIRSIKYKIIKTIVYDEQSVAKLRAKLGNQYNANLNPVEGDVDIKTIQTTAANNGFVDKIEIYYLIRKKGEIWKIVSIYSPDVD